MRRLKEKFEKWMLAATFAKVNEQKRALEIIGASSRRTKGLSFDTLMSAVAFAEAGEHGFARECLGVKPERNMFGGSAIPKVKIWVGNVVLEPASIPGVKVWYGTAAA